MECPRCPQTNDPCTTHVVMPSGPAGEFTLYHSHVEHIVTVTDSGSRLKLSLCVWKDRKRRTITLDEFREIGLHSPVSQEQALCKHVLGGWYRPMGVGDEEWQACKKCNQVIGRRKIAKASVEEASVQKGTLDAHNDDVDGREGDLLL